MSDQSKSTKRVLVTGGAGFIGSHIVDACVARGWEVAVVDDLSTGRRENVNPKARLIELDIRDEERLSDAIEQLRPDAVAHQAAQASVVVSMRDPGLDVRVNVLGSINLLNACVRHSVGRLVFASTGGAIYGEVPEGQRADEAAPTEPASPYAISKWAVEKLIRVFRKEHGLQATVLRYANVYGPRQDPHGEAGVMAIFTQRALEGLPLQINARSRLGDDGCVRDYVYVSDVVAANMAALDGGVPHEVMNVCTGVETTTAQLASVVEQASGTQARRTAGERRSGDLERSVLDPSLFEQVVAQPVALADGARTTVSWFREHAAR